MNLRKNKNNGYYFFYDCILRCVVAKMKWKKLVRKNLPISSLITVSDEAFALLVLENGWEKWKQHYENKLQDVKEKKKIKSLYTNDERDGNSSFDGWKPEGLERFNFLVYKVIKDRDSLEGKAFDSRYNESLLESLSEAVPKKKRPEELNPQLQARNEIQLYNPNLETETQFAARMEAHLKNTQAKDEGTEEQNNSVTPDKISSALLYAGTHARDDVDFHETEV